MLQLCELLEAYLSWKQVEKVFWTWMVGLIQSFSNAEHPGFFISLHEPLDMMQASYLCMCAGQCGRSDGDC